MPNRNALDIIIQRFQHRWETNRQYRAVLSGGCALVLLVTLCGLMGVVASATQAVLASTGFGANQSSSAAISAADQNTGSAALSANPEFPTPAVTFVVGNVPAASPIPSSQTPAPTPTVPPTPTPVPTATPCKTNCGGGPHDSVSITGVSPNPVVSGQSVTISWHTQIPNEGVNVIIKGTGTILSAGQAALSSDGSGNGSWTVNIPGGFCGGSLQFLVNVQSGAGTLTNIPCN